MTEFNNKKLNEAPGTADAGRAENIEYVVISQTRQKLDEVLEPSHEEIINPEDLYANVLANAYGIAIGKSMGMNLEFCINNIAHGLSIAFKKQGKIINEEQVMDQINIMFKYQKRMDSINNGFLDPQESAMRMLSESNHFIKNLCMRLQLSGLLE